MCVRLSVEGGNAACPRTFFHCIQYDRFTVVFAAGPNEKKNKWGQIYMNKRDFGVESLTFLISASIL